jgi:hypothetical protein
MVETNNHGKDENTMTKQEFIQTLIDKDLSFGWYNGEFVTNPKV